MEYTYENIKNQIIKIIREEIGWEENGCTIDDETKLIDDLKLDSLMIVQLIVAVEERFQVEFNDTEELLRGMETVRSLAEWIKGMLYSN